MDTSSAIQQAAVMQGMSQAQAATAVRSLESIDVYVQPCENGVYARLRLPAGYHHRVFPDMNGVQEWVSGLLAP
jgi:hypothetical protein